jgi:hypothetical protein
MDKTLSDAILVANNAGLTDRDLAAAVEAATAARLAEAERPGLVPLTHPDLPDRPPYLADPEAVEVYLRSGWQRVPEEPPADEPKPAKAAKAAPKKETSA